VWAKGEEEERRNRVRQGGRRETRRGMQRSMQDEKKKKYEVKVEIRKARHEKRGVSKPRMPRPSPPIYAC
jgi:hypothetical protein